jgi:hypothetical protein
VPHESAVMGEDPPMTKRTSVIQPRKMRAQLEQAGRVCTAYLAEPRIVAEPPIDSARGMCSRRDNRVAVKTRGLWKEMDFAISAQGACTTAKSGACNRSTRRRAQVRGRRHGKRESSA